MPSDADSSFIVETVMMKKIDKVEIRMSLHIQNKDSLWGVQDKTWLTLTPGAPGDQHPPGTYL